MTSNATPSEGTKRSFLRQLGPALALILVVVALFVFGPSDTIVFQTLREHREALLAFVADDALLAGAIYFAVYTLVVAFSLPGGAMMTIAGGFLFGFLQTTVVTVFAATLGATLLFLVARGAVGTRMREKAGPWMSRMADGFRENELSYLLVLRLVPLFPFFVVNLVPAFIGVGLRTYVVGTFFGIIPGTAVFALAGGALGSALDAADGFDVGVVLKPEVIAALVGLAVLALVPVVYKKLKGRRGAGR